MEEAVRKLPRGTQGLLALLTKMEPQMNADEHRCWKSNSFYLRLSAFICGLILFHHCALAQVDEDAIGPLVHAPARFDGKHFAGAGDVEYLKLLDISARM